MTRSVWKGPFVDPSLVKKVKAIRGADRRDVIKTWSRRSTIVPEFVGMNFAVHNGKSFIPVYVEDSMVGCKLGEFSPTRNYHGHGGDKKGKK